MLDQFLFRINELLIAAGYLAYIAAFIWGVCSVIFSPCHLASIPLIIGYVSGFNTTGKIKYAFWYSLIFSIGLFISIALMGIITASLGQMMGNMGRIWNIIIGIILIIIALYLFGLIKINIPSLEKLRTEKKGVWGAFLLGLSYGIVSGPCTFGFIAPMLAIAAIKKTMLKGILLIIIFASGHCLPILIGGTSTELVKKIILSGKMQTGGLYLKKAAGIIFIIIALYIIFY